MDPYVLGTMLHTYWPPRTIEDYSGTAGEPTCLSQHVHSAHTFCNILGGNIWCQKIQSLVLRSSATTATTMYYELADISQDNASICAIGARFHNVGCYNPDSY